MSTSPTPPTPPSAADRIFEQLVRVANLLYIANRQCQELTELESLVIPDVVRHLSMAKQHIEAASRLLDVLRRRETNT